MESRITEGELLEALRKAFAAVEDQPDDAFTTAELAEMTGRGKVTIQSALKEMIAANEAECVRVRRVAIDGRMARVPAYRLNRPLRRAA